MSTTYAYKVRDKVGAFHEGSIEGQSEQLVVAKLPPMGLRFGSRSFCLR